MDETKYLLSTRMNKSRLMKSIEQLDKREIVEHKAELDKE